MSCTEFVIVTAVLFAFLVCCSPREWRTAAVAAPLTIGFVWAVLQLIRWWR